MATKKASSSGSSANPLAKRGGHVSGPRPRCAARRTIRTEGGLLPADLLARVASQDRELPGVRPADFHLVLG